MIWGYHCTTVSGDLHMILPSRYIRRNLQWCRHWWASETKPSNTGSSKKVLLLERSAVANLYTRKWGTCWNSNLEAHLDEKDLPTSDRHWENPYFPGVVFLYEPKTEARILQVSGTPGWFVEQPCQVFHLQYPIAMQLRINQSVCHLQNINLIIIAIWTSI